jgi:cold shock CspA family protein
VVPRANELVAPRLGSRPVRGARLAVVGGEPRIREVTIMKLPLQITFRDMEPSAALEEYVNKRADTLDGFYNRIMSCRIVVEAPHRHSRKGKRFHVRIDMTVPGDELVIGRDPALNLAHEDAHAAIDAAFDEAQRRLEDYVRERRGHVKHHEPTAMHARVKRTFPQQDYGFVVTPDGEDVYFHRNAVRNEQFDRLQVGDVVRCAIEMGDKGPQATFVERTSRTTVEPVPPAPRM